MGSVCLDDAWQSCTSEMEVWDPQEEASKVTAETEVGHLSRPPPEKERSKETKEKQERSQQRLCTEITKLRQQLDERDRTQSIVLYVALAIVVILLVVVLQSTWKLQHATDCLLWYSRR